MRYCLGLMIGFLALSGPSRGGVEVGNAISRGQGGIFSPSTNLIPRSNKNKPTYTNNNRWEIVDGSVEEFDITEDPQELLRLNLPSRRNSIWKSLNCNLKDVDVFRRATVLEDGELPAWEMILHVNHYILKMVALSSSDSINLFCNNLAVDFRDKIEEFLK